MVKVFYYTKCDDLNITIFDRICGLFSKSIQKRIKSITNEEYLKQYIIGYLLCVYGLFDITNKLYLPELRYSKNGKPYFVDADGLFFNISHSGSCVICCFSDTEIGVDIEAFKEVDSSFISYICSKEELCMINQSINPLKAFLNVWTLKESIVKLEAGSIIDLINKKDFDTSIIDSKSMILHTEKEEYVFCISRKKE